MAKSYFTLWGITKLSGSYHQAIVNKVMNTHILLMAKSYFTLWGITKLSGSYHQVIINKIMNTHILLMAKHYCTLWGITKLSGRIVLITCESVNIAFIMCDTVIAICAPEISHILFCVTVTSRCKCLLLWNVRAMRLLKGVYSVTFLYWWV